MRSKATKNEAVGPAGLVTPRCQIWGVLNVTPDSFCDGGRYLQADAALQQGERLWRDGATVIDIGGASSRPRGLVYGAGADPVPAREEQARVVPVIEALAAQLPEACLSVDTCRAEVARAALAAGADIVNDISGGQSAALLDAVAAAEAEIVLMHNRGDGALDAAHTHYDDLWQTVQEELAAAATRAEAAGIDRARIWLDPGLGFAKTAPQSFALLAQLERWQPGPYRRLIGPSNKSFIAHFAPTATGVPPAPDARQAGTAVSLMMVVLAGAEAVRVHDVAAARQALLLSEAYQQVRHAG